MFAAERRLRLRPAPLSPCRKAPRPASPVFPASFMGTSPPLASFPFDFAVNTLRLTRRRWQSSDPSRHRPEQPPGQMAFRQQRPVIAGPGPNIMPIAVLPALVSAPARLSRRRPSVPSAHRGAARRQSPGVNYWRPVFCGWCDPGRHPRPPGPTALCRNVLGFLAGRGGGAEIRRRGLGGDETAHVAAGFPVTS
jgi:hypothetical protein